MMIILNEAEKLPELNQDFAINFTKILAPFAPHLCEEMYSFIMKNSNDSIFNTAWPKYDESKTIDSVINLVMNINGKKKSLIEVAKGTEEDAVLAIIKADINLQKFIDGQEIKKTIFVKDRLINFIV
jgi:leucyl-tRNA synthetase